jgi:hypothetical protein
MLSNLMDSRRKGLVIAENDDGYDEDHNLLKEGPSSSRSEEDVLEIRIKSAKDATVHISRGATIASLQTAVLEQVKPEFLSSNDNSYVRLICKGRLLAPETASLADLKVEDLDVVHAVITKSSQKGPQALLQTGQVLSRRLRGTGIGADGRAIRNHPGDADPEESEEDDEEQGSERLGFDRLRASGLSRHEIRALRVYFNRSVEEWIRTHPEAAAAAASHESDGVRRRLRQEDVWMATQGPASEFRLNLAGWSQYHSLRRAAASSDLFQRPGGGSGGTSAVGTDRDFIWGFMLGFFVGFLMLVWVWMPTVPHKQKLGILTGISCQLALGLIHGKDGNEDDALGNGVTEDNGIFAN